MFCRNCGTEIPEGNKFCEQCGTPVILVKKRKEQDPEKAPKKPAAETENSGGIFGLKRKHLILIAVIIIAVAGGLGTFAAYNTSTVNAEYNDKLDTANKYVSDGDYDSAINTFSELIDIRPKKEEAYLGLADVYLIQGRYDDAEKVLEKGEKNTGSSAITDKKKSVGTQKTNQEYLKEQELAVVDSTYNRGENDGGLISSISIDDVDGHPRWLDVSMNDKNRELTFTIRGEEGGKIKKICDESLLLGVMTDISNLFGARYDIYTAKGKDKTYLCIGSDEIPDMETSVTGVRIYEIGEDSIDKETYCVAWTSLGEWATAVDDEEVAGYDTRMEEPDVDDLKAGAKKLENKIGTLGLTVSFDVDEENRRFLADGVCYNKDRKSCDKHISFIQFGEFEDVDGLPIYETTNHTLIKDYTDLRERLESSGSGESGQAKDAFAAYAKYLRENISDIEAYETSGSEFSSGKDRAVSFYDMDGNGIPEMFVMKITQGNDVWDRIGFIFIYTWADGKLREVDYKISSVVSKTGRIQDFNVFAGGHCDYAIYTDKDGKVYMYNGTFNNSTYYCLETFEAGTRDGMCVLKITDELTGTDGAEEPDGPGQKYTDNGKAISADESESGFEQGFSKYNKMIIYGSPDLDDEYGENAAIWKKFDPANTMNMTGRNAIEYAEKRSK